MKNIVFIRKAQTLNGIKDGIVFEWNCRALIHVRSCYNCCLREKNSTRVTVSQRFIVSSQLKEKDEVKVFMRFDWQRKDLLFFFLLFLCVDYFDFSRLGDSWQPSAVSLYLYLNSLTRLIYIRIAIKSLRFHFKIFALHPSALNDWMQNNISSQRWTFQRRF